MNYQYTIIALLCFGALHAMEQDGVVSKVANQTPFERGYYNDDYELEPTEYTEWKFLNQKQSPIAKPYIPDEKEEKMTCCSIFMKFLNYWNNSHAYLYPVSSFPK